MNTKWGHRFTCPSGDWVIIFTKSSESREGLGAYRAKQNLLPLLFYFLCYSVILSPEFWSGLGNRTHDLSLRSPALYVRSRSCFLGGVAAGKQRHRSKRDGDGNIYVKKATRLVSRRTPLHMTYCCRRLFRYFTGLRNERQKDKWKLPWREVAEDL